MTFHDIQICIRKVVLVLIVITHTNSFIHRRFKIDRFDVRLTKTLFFVVDSFIKIITDIYQKRDLPLLLTFLQRRFKLYEVCLCFYLVCGSDMYSFYLHF